ncbi:rhodanese-like domain-containing protein [Coraliomargarita sp. SDUM461004]|uniref:Rhodanese-like domain-containing protein n=1 Tax=Thalassobacterium sedimentorum TaxID=3041258 RepID=A0ABU1AN86_9BACT|nr:rhodanese-like domain-containing protein [Coraliomargarita sp. SDUM461004]MDQ8196260.1 rhodanese-like domain-containing protein [Coraliomargarita sp. SDUM461004]
MRKRSYISMLCLLFLLPIPFAVVNVWLNPSAPSWNPMQLGEGEVALEHLLNWEDDYILVDARAPEAYQGAHMPEAINLYAGEFDAQILSLLDVWSPGRSIIVYCDSRQCGASEEMATHLREDFQMERVFVLKGGWESWLEATQEIKSSLGGAL